MITVIITAFIVIFSADGDNIEHGSHGNNADYLKIYEVGRECSQKYNITSYNTYTYGVGVEANDSVKCAVACEMKSRHYVNDIGELDYLQDEMKKLFYYVVEECFENWKHDDSNDCSRAFNFQTCIVEQDADYYRGKRVQNCLLSLQGKNDSNHFVHPHPRYVDFRDYSCISMLPYCYMDFHRYVIRKGVGKFISATEETGFLDNYPTEKTNLEENLEKCYEGLTPNMRYLGFGGAWHMPLENAEDCNKYLKSYTCLIAEFQKILNLVI